MMKNKRFFEEAELVVIKFGDTDIITTSEKHDNEVLKVTNLEGMNID